MVVEKAEQARRQSSRNDSVVENASLVELVKTVYLPGHFSENRCPPDEGGITCNHRQEPQVTITTMGPQGVHVEHKPFTQVFHAGPLPLFTATYSPQYDDFDVDVDCGAQRWRGNQGATEVRKALVRCGVTREVAKRIVADAAKGGSPVRH